MDLYHFHQMTQNQHEHEMLTMQSQRFEAVMSDLNIPIGSNAALQSSPRRGVVKIENIPYAVTRQEVQQVFGRHARLAPDWPIHIIMERVSGKTTDCYVEFISSQEARDVIDRVKQNVAIGLIPRIGIRHIHIVLSNQDELMQAMFPMAKCIKWADGLPVEADKRPGEEWSVGFTGFVTNEEMFCTVRYSEHPRRSKFAYKVPQRPYEFMISTIRKYPWSATSMYTVHERNKVFQALRFMIEALVARMKKEQVVGLDNRLVLELIQTGLRCPAFNPRMKFCLAHVGEDHRTLQGMPEVWMTYFPFDTLTWLPNCNPVNVEFYASLLSKANITNHSAKGLMQHWDNKNHLEPYGRFWFEWDEQTLVKSSFTFADCVDYEKNVLREMLAAGFKNSQMSSNDKDCKKNAVGSLTSDLSTPSTKQVSRLASAVTAPEWHPPRSGNVRVDSGSRDSQAIRPSGTLDMTYQFPRRNDSSHASKSWVTDNSFSTPLGAQHWSSRSESHIQFPGFGRGQGLGQVHTQNRGQAPCRGQARTGGQTQGRGHSQAPFTAWAGNHSRENSRGGLSTDSRGLSQSENPSNRGSSH